MFCSKCGKENSNEAIFCSNCGCRMTDEEHDNNESTSSEILQTDSVDCNKNNIYQSTKKRNLGCSAGCLVVILITIFSLYSLFKDYSIVSKDDNTIIAEATINHSFPLLMCNDVSDIVWKLATKYNNYNKIIIKFSVKGENNYGEVMTIDLNPYMLTSDEIKEVSKYKDKLSYRIYGNNLSAFYLADNKIK